MVTLQKFISLVFFDSSSTSTVTPSSVLPSLSLILLICWLLWLSLPSPTSVPTLQPSSISDSLNLAARLTWEIYIASRSPLFSRLRHSHPSPATIVALMTRIGHALTLCLLSLKLPLPCSLTTRLQSSVSLKS